jgi:hypothetical protein
MAHHRTTPTCVGQVGVAVLALTTLLAAQVQASETEVKK